MKIIAIYPGHNATASVYIDGRCECIYHEEKFNNIKNYIGFPIKALEHLSKLYNFDDIDFFVFPATEAMFVGIASPKENVIENISQSRLRNVYNKIEYAFGLKTLSTSFRNFVLHNMVTPKAKKIVEKILRDKFSVPKNKIKRIDHHLSHCLTPFYFYNLKSLEKDFLLMSMDGAGDFSCSKAYIYRHNEETFKKISDSSLNASIGLLYSEITKFLGMKPNEHEYKIMGLAAYVSNEKYYNHIYEKLKKIIWFDKKYLKFESKFNTNIASLYFKDSFFCERFDNVSAAIQKLTEELVIDWIKTAVEKTGIKNIALSGGVFMNVKMNQKIIDIPELESVFFQPSCGDDSSVIGAAAKIFLDNKIPLKEIETMYLGHKYAAEEAGEFIKNLDREKYEINFYDDIEKEIAILLSKFEIVARFKGAGEWGARSLCNRAILGNASDLKTFYQVNDMIKMRDFWMPFAPAILEEWADKYIKNWKKINEKAYDSTKYMIVTMDSTSAAQDHLRAAIHQKDKTLRPQIVSRKDNPDLHKLLKYYEELTHMGGIMNTSLNIHGYPMVGTLEQALFTLENSGLKHIAVENWLISKK